jgi:hypothetical protein
VAREPGLGPEPEPQEVARGPGLGPEPEPQEVAWEPGPGPGPEPQEVAREPGPGPAPRVLARERGRKKRWGLVQHRPPLPATSLRQRRAGHPIQAERCSPLGLMDSGQAVRLKLGRGGGRGAGGGRRRDQFKQPPPRTRASHRPAADDSGLRPRPEF